VLAWAFLRRVFDPVAGPSPGVLPALLVLGAVAIVLAGRRRGPVAGSAAVAVTTAVAAAYAAIVVMPGLVGLQAIPQLGMRIAAVAQPGARIAQYGVVSAGLVFYTRHTVDTVTSDEAAVQFLSAPGEAFLVLPHPGADALIAHAPGTFRQLASSSRLVVRFDRLFGDRSPYEDGFVVVTNRPADLAGPGGSRLPTVR
jgi:hypothetical protein